MRTVSRATKLRLIGYWQAPSFEVFFAERPAFRFGPPRSPQQLRVLWESVREEQAVWPDPARFVDATWNSNDRAEVVRHLECGAPLVRYRGLSICRFCGRDNGSSELTDGVYFWPEGLAHYLRDHQLRPPAEFVAQVAARRDLFANLAAPSFDDMGQRRSGGFEGDLSALDVGVISGRRPAAAEGERTRWLELDSPKGAVFPGPWVEIDEAWWRRRADGRGSDREDGQS